MKKALRVSSVVVAVVVVVVCIVVVRLCGFKAGKLFSMLCILTSPEYRLAGLVVKACASGAEDPGVRIPLATGFFPGRVIPVTSKLAL